MLSDLEKAYEYLQQRNLVAAFVYNCENASAAYQELQPKPHGSFIRRAFYWASTPEGRNFWDMHDEAVRRLHIRLSAADVLNYIGSHSTTAQPYEYW